jgi:hypothetical protein
MKNLSVISLSLLTAIATLSASEQSIAASRTFENYKNYLLEYNPSGIYDIEFRRQTVSIDTQKMLYLESFKHLVTGNDIVRCIVSICAWSGGHPANYYTDAYLDAKTYQFIEHEEHEEHE